MYFSEFWSRCKLTFSVNYNESIYVEIRKFEKKIMAEGMTLCFHVLHIPLKLVQALKSENADI